MTKDARLTLRITAELDLWLGHEAASRGLDKAAFARMALFERMNGPPAQVHALLAAAVPVQRDVLTVASTPDASLPQDFTNEPSQIEPAGDPSALDVDALVNEELNKAEALGLADARNIEGQAAAESLAGAGVRPLMRRAPPFSQSLPAFLSQ